MIHTAKLACVMLGLILPTAVSAEELAPLQAGTFSLYDHVASVYYTVENGNFEVVTTFAPTAGVPAPARCTAQLAPGQIATVSVGAYDTSVPPAVLRFERDGDTLRAEIVDAAEAVGGSASLDPAAVGDVGLVGDRAAVVGGEE